MVRKVRPASLKPKRPSKSAVKEQTSAQQLVHLEKLAAERGIKPVEDFDQFLAHVGDFWPPEESCDEFIAWLRQLRRGAQE